MILLLARSIAMGAFSLALLLTFAVAARAQEAEKPAVFRIKYLSDDSVYLAAGHNAGIEEGMKLSVVKPPPDGAIDNGIRFRGLEHIAELQVITVADSSSICAILSTSGELRVGQLAFLTVDSVKERRETETADETDKYPIVVGFTYGDPLDDEVRQSDEKKILQESPVGRIRGRFGFDYGGTPNPAALVPAKWAWSSTPT